MEWFSSLFFWPKAENTIQLYVSALHCVKLCVCVCVPVCGCKCVSVYLWSRSPCLPPSEKHPGRLRWPRWLSWIKDKHHKYINPLSTQEVLWKLQWKLSRNYNSSDYVSSKHTVETNCNSTVVSSSSPHTRELGTSSLWVKVSQTKTEKSG